MKKLVVFSIVCFFGAFISCGDDDTITELGWKNNSEQAVNNILWHNGDSDNPDAQWTKDGGYEGEGAGVTELKEVNVLSGQVGCIIDTGEEPEPADVIIEEVSDDSITIAEGEAQILNINATSSTAKKK